MIRNPNGSILIRFTHGLGDACQLVLVLRHLKEEYPGLGVDVASLRGKHTLFDGHCRRSYCLDDGEPDRAGYDQVYDLDWWECHQSYPDCPSTKTSQCLKDVFGLQPLSLPCEIRVASENRERVDAYVAGLPSDQFVLLHVNGNTSSQQKDIDAPTVKRLCDLLLLNGVTPVILDWDRRSRLPDNRRIFCPGADHPLWKGYGTGDGNTLAGLIDRARLVVACDSGPGHCAASCSTPAVLVWTGHHPLSYFDLADHVLHLVPKDHVGLIRGDRATGLRYFRTHYRHKVYHNLADDLCTAVSEQLGLARQLETPFMALSATAYAEDYYEEHKRAGLDYLFYGDWQRAYGKWLVDGLGLHDRQVLDVGCACGSIANGIAEAGAVVHAVDLSNHMVDLGRRRFGDRLATINVMDAVNLHHFPDGSLDCVHANQTFEHLKPKLVPFALEELHRVLRPGGLLFTVHDTAESFAREGRKVGNNGEVDGDPTHVAVFPRATWDEAFRVAGFVDVSAEYRGPMFEDPASFPRRWGYQWDWWLIQKPENSNG